MTIADPDNLLRLQTHLAGAIVDHDEIVPRAVHFDETQHVESILAAALSIVMSSECASPARTETSLDISEICPLVLAHAKADLGPLRRSHCALRNGRRPQQRNSRATAEDAERR